MANIRRGEAYEVCDLIDELRGVSEGCEVAIVSDNADFGGPECLVIWRTLYGEEYRATGATVLECLQKLVAYKTGKFPDPMCKCGHPASSL